VPVSVFTLLVDDATCGESGGIDFNSDDLLRGPNGQDWFGGEGSLELIKSLLLGGAPDKRNIFLGKIMKRAANLREVFDETLIEVSKANKALYFFEAFGDGPINDGFNFDWVHRDFAMTDNQTKIIYLGLFKFALFRTEIKIIHLKAMEDFVNDLMIFF
jgi:hypothetical protein